MMRNKILVYYLSSVVLLLALYTVYWFISIASLKSLLFSNYGSSDSKKYTVYYDEANISGFPFSPQILLKNFKLHTENISFESESLKVSYALSNNLLSIKIPDNKFTVTLKNIDSQHSILCQANQDMLLKAQLRSNSSTLLSKKESVFHIVNSANYHNLGMKCQNGNTVTMSNEIDVTIQKKHPSQSRKITSLEFKMLVGERQVVINNKPPFDYPSISSEISFDFIDHVKYLENIDARIKNISFIGKDFSITINGIIESSFKPHVNFRGKIDVIMANYKKGINFFMDSYLAQKNDLMKQKIEKLIYDISEKHDDNIKLSLCIKEEDDGSSCGAYFNEIIQKIQAIYNDLENITENNVSVTTKN